MTEPIIDTLFYNSLLLFSDESMEKLKNSTVAIGGIGGIGSITTEMLVRIGIQNFRVADIDKYELINFNRQIYSTNQTLGMNKASVAKDRIMQINSKCNVKEYTDGINLDNAEEFCKNADVILLEVDKESIKVLVHRIAKSMKIPVICGSRSSLEESRWCVAAKLWDYKTDENILCYDETNHPELAKMEIKDMTPELLNEYDEKITAKKEKMFRDSLINKEDLFKSITPEELQNRIDNYENYGRRHVCSVIANTAGCLAATSAIRYILGHPAKKLTMNLWE